MPPPDLVTRDVHRLLLGADSVEYLLVRRRGRRGVGIKVDSNGLTVSAPLTMPLSRVEALVRESERWVLRKMAEWRERRVAPMEWRDGASLPYLGRSLRLTLEDGPRAAVIVGHDELTARLRSPAPERVQRLVVSWYREVAQLYLAGRTFTLARTAGLTPPRVMISGALARWGSCNARREVRLAWRLVKARPELIDYVICHELAHLRHMNHSRAFWDEVARQCPGYGALRDELFATDHLYRSF
jgi:predicted metal-dependent hydrolase